MIGGGWGEGGGIEMIKEIIKDLKFHEMKQAMNNLTYDEAQENKHMCAALSFLGKPTLVFKYSLEFLNSLSHKACTESLKITDCLQL